MLDRGQPLCPEPRLAFTGFCRDGGDGAGRLDGVSACCRRNLAKRRAENAAGIMNRVVYPLRQAPGPPPGQGAQVLHLPQLPHGVPGAPGQGPDRDHLPQVRRGNPRQKLTARKYQLPARGTRAGSFFALPLIRSTPPGRPPAASHRRLLCSRHRRRARPHSRR